MGNYYQGSSIQLVGDSLGIPPPKVDRGSEFENMKTFLILASSVAYHVQASTFEDACMERSMLYDPISKYIERV